MASFLCFINISIIVEVTFLLGILLENLSFGAYCSFIWKLHSKFFIPYNRDENVFLNWPTCPRGGVNWSYAWGKLVKFWHLAQF